MIIEQTREQMRDAIAFHTGSSFRSLRLVHSKAWSAPYAVVAEAADVAFDIHFNPAEVHLGSDCLTVDTDFNFSMSSETGEKQPLIFVECRFEAQYELVSDYKPLDAQIEAFRVANAIFNCWPFFREYVNNTVVRMNFPPPPIPFLRIVRKKEEVTSGATSAPQEKITTEPVEAETAVAPSQRTKDLGATRRRRSRARNKA